MRSYKILIALIPLLSACTQMLEVETVSVLTNASMWKTPADSRGAMNGMYSQLRSALAGDLVYWGDYRTGFIGNGLSPSTSFQDMFNNTLDRDDTGTNWADLYTTINDCNLIIRYVPNINFSNEQEKSFILANAYFVRAFMYFNIARVWGDAPIVLSGFVSDDQEDMYTERRPVEEVLAQVDADVSKAVSLFPDDRIESRHLASKSAAYMLQADYALWMYKTRNGGPGMLAKAKEALNYVLSNSNSTLGADYESVFRNENSSEIIFSLNFEINEFTGGAASDYLVPLQYVQNKNLIQNPVQAGSTQQWVSFDTDFVRFLKENEQDSRSRVSYSSFYDEANGVNFTWINKFLGEWVNETRYFSSDPRIYRYAEAVLFMAEAELAAGNGTEAIKYLNIIASRAYGVDNFYAPGITDKELETAILNERLKEFTLEGKSWFDLIRFGVVFERVETLQGKENKPNILYWPVNSASINSNPNIKQTDGY